ncbi:MmgE/PrpD family protein [Paracoccus haematequi]|uniref:MmgE/PrpD family protein n=1 Tax=Paracoccus haematequi TaxID=2491866 RepID=A0A3S4CIG2_9RHOB|nr:MmgE/PrpD family protein [Paracoccus haematequi]VDS07879.1 MmgE/PrpD family protein [Paracoccus haematequi]
MRTTLDLICDLAAMPAPALPAAARRLAGFSLFDQMVCGIAADAEPVARALRSYVAAEGSRGQASLIGGGLAAPRAAALANGTASHALDYDDTHFAHIGHLAVGIGPAALAVGEETGQGADAVIDAFLLGAEAAIRAGLHLGAAHYDRGFHQTATAGAFGATVAAGRLYGLSREAMIRAIGLCSSRASGLKNQFGTMGKPLNAGLSAANGVECAGLALAGLTSADNGFDGPLGFVATHADQPDPARAHAPAPGQFLFTDIRYKLHACCHGTHAMIEALRLQIAEHSLTRDQVAKVALRTSPRWLNVCDIREPRTGLEVKFSYVWLAGMVLGGIPTGSDQSFSDSCAGDPALAAFARQVEVTGDPGVGEMQAAGEIVLKTGERLALSWDLAAPVPDDSLAASLRAKAIALIGAQRADALWQAIEGASLRSARDLGALIRAPA